MTKKLIDINNRYIRNIRKDIENGKEYLRQLESSDERIKQIKIVEWLEWEVLRYKEENKQIKKQILINW